MLKNWPKVIQIVSGKPTLRPKQSDFPKPMPKVSTGFDHKKLPEDHIAKEW